MRKCPNESDLTRVLEGGLPPETEQQIEDHVEHCRRCERALAEQPVDEALVEKLRDMERNRRENASALSRLPETKRTLTTTLFGNDWKAAGPMQA